MKRAQSNSTTGVGVPGLVLLAPGMRLPAGRTLVAVGDKAGALLRLAAAGLPVPAGFVWRVPGDEKQWDAPLQKGVRWIERHSGGKFGQGTPPLLLVVRRATAGRFPGDDNACLGVGLTAATAAALRSTWTAATWRQWGEHCVEVSDDPWLSLREAIRKIIAESTPRGRGRGGTTTEPSGTWVIVQAMALGVGGAGDETKHGVGQACTRDPVDGSAAWSGSLIAEAVTRSVHTGAAGRLDSTTPATGTIAVVGSALEPWRTKVESALGRAALVDFVWQAGRLHIVHARPARLAPAVALAVDVELARDKVITQEQAIARTSAESLAPWLSPTVAERAQATTTPLATGLAAAPGAAVGRLAFSATEAIRRAARGEKIILVRPETYAQDVLGMQACQGILTSTGGMTSHAAVVARGWGKACIVGAAALRLDDRRGVLVVGKVRLTRSDTITLDGHSGRVYRGELELAQPRTPEALGTLLDWCDQRRQLQIFANADTPEDARRARALGAQGIGLCRTEHMFFAPQRLELVRRILLTDESRRRDDLYRQLIACQRGDFVEMFAALAGLPVTIRLLDPPLHEFFPGDPAAQAALAQALRWSRRRLVEHLETLREANPMLGRRGSRLLVTMPELLAAQVRAVVEAWALARERGLSPRPALLVPLVSSEREMAWLRQHIQQAAIQTRELLALDRPGDLAVETLPIGAMIETPRAALLADRIAAHADFISLGTNDLSQLTLGMSRDDVAGYLPTYLQQGLLPHDPFARLDEEGVGELIKHAVTLARVAKPGIKVSVCGEHGGEPASIMWCQRAGVDAVSCSPWRLPVARLAAAQAALPAAP